MSDYACAKCGSTSFANEIRTAVFMAGPSNELQVSGLVPVRRCANEQCNAITVATQLKFGDAVNLAPVPTPEQQANLARMREAVAEAEGVTQKDPQPAVETSVLPPVAGQQADVQAESVGAKPPE